ncbi:MAG: SDR family oxidoreductase [Proteobacteria bacterium]|nr:SDR family oxidoreductase [Pseudomonadota bacterium]MCP4918575.1 SDR family oxidoreductase [Pseudomonadota bacterium]
MAIGFAAAGAKVAVVGRREDPLKETVALITEAGGTAAYSAGFDVRDPAAVEAGVTVIEDQLGPVTGLVNNAAGNFLACTEDISPNGFNAIVSIVLHGSFHCTSTLGKRWIERGHAGRVLSIVTTYAWTGSAFVVPSACAKAGVLAMTRSLAVEWAEYGIRLNAIAPGPFPTKGAFAKLMPPGMDEEAKAAIPLKRFGKPDELADLATYLMSDMAAYVTGEVVTIDGGEWLANGQEFGRFTKYPRDNVKAILKQIRGD